MNLKILLPAILLITAISCKKTQLNTDMKIDAPISIRLRQTVPNKGLATLAFYCTTGRFAGMDYRLVADIKWTGSSAAVSFTKIIPGYSRTPPGPAIAQIGLGSLPVGNYPMSIKVNTTTYQGTFIVSDTDYQFSFPQAHDSVLFVDNSLKKMQLNTIWGSARTFADTTVNYVNGFIDSLKFFGAGTYAGPVGNYNVFHSDSGFSNKPLATGFLEKQFIYSYSGEMSDIQQLVNDYDRKQPFQGFIQFQVYTGQDNKRFNVPNLVVAVE